MARWNPFGPKRHGNGTQTDEWFEPPTVLRWPCTYNGESLDSNIFDKMAGAWKYWTLRFFSFFCPSRLQMGVNHLWSILEPVRKKENLSALSNKTLCVDLSGWICEANCAKGLKQNVSKPHLRNLFFRLLHLTRLGVKLVFVVDGKPPELKWEAIAKRIQARNGGQFWKGKNTAKAGSGARVGRSHFAVWVREVRWI